MSYEKAKEIIKLLKEADADTRFYLSEFMTFLDGEPMCCPDLSDAIEELACDDEITEERTTYELNMGLQLKSINVAVWKNKDGDIDTEILQDKTNDKGE